MKFVCTVILALFVKVALATTCEWLTAVCHMGCNLTQDSRTSRNIKGDYTSLVISVLLEIFAGVMMMIIIIKSTFTLVI